MNLHSIDLSNQVPTTGIPVASANHRRKWMAFTNTGVGYMDLYWLDGATVKGTMRLLAGQGVVFSMSGDMPWDGALSATAEINNETLYGVEVEDWDA